MKSACLMLVIRENGFSIVRVPSDEAGYHMPPVTVEMQAADPRLGLIADSSSAETFVKALNATLKEVTGQEMLALIPDDAPSAQGN